MSQMCGIGPFIAIPAMVVAFGGPQAILGWVFGAVLALKLMETSYLSAQAFSGADLMHGPLASVDSSVPVLAVVADGPGGAAMHPVLERVIGAGADVFTVGTAAAVSASTSGIVLPDGVPEELSPILEILPFQRLAMHLAVARGQNPDAPRGLTKVTQTL